MAVFGLVSAVAGLIKVRYLIDKAIIDNIVFRFHYRITSAILFVCCILCTANSLIGDPINCVNDGSIPTNVINTFCWIKSTFTLPHQLHKPLHTHVVSPGVGPYVEGKDQEKYHSYYQWVPFMLFFQGVLFYIPHWIWKNWEEGKVGMISDGMRGAQIGSKEERAKRTSHLANYIIDTMHLHNGYATGYFLCEALNFINVVGNIFFLDVFLGGSFLKYGVDVVRFAEQVQENRTDPMITVFPRLTKCTFRKFGASGSLQKHDTLCVLALNILNEKIFIFLWFWLIILSVLTGLALVYSLALIVLPTVRESVLKRRFRWGAPAGVAKIVEKTQVGDFMLLHLLGQNMSQMAFGELLEEVAKGLSDLMHMNMASAPNALDPDDPDSKSMYPMSKFPKSD